MLYYEDLSKANEEILKGFQYDDGKKMATELLMKIVKQ